MTAKARTTRQSPRPRGRAGLRSKCAVDFGPDHWVIVKGTVEQVSRKINDAVNGPDMLVELERFDGTPLFIHAAKVILVGVPA